MGVKPALTANSIVDQYTQHPLALAARNLPSAQDQLKKHLEGDFEWVLTIRVPKQASSGTKNVPHAKNEETCDTVKLYFGCNIYPGVKALHEIREPPQQESYTLLVTPLEDNAELDTATDLKNDETSMALSANIAEHAMLLRPLDKQPDVRVTELSPPRSTFSEDDSFVDPIPSRSPAKSIARIEDSVEALDQLEEQLEAFDVAASMRDAASHEVKKPTERVPVQSLTSNMHENRGATPRSSNGSPMVRLSTPRVKITGPRRYPSSGRPASMISMGSPKLLDSLKLKVEDKALLQAPPKKSAKKELTSLLPPKQPAKSTKRVTVAAFELPGEAVARRLKEQREARLSMAVTSETPKVSAVSGIGRPKSGKPPTRPIFELPGEAISRRKREERDARLKAQEEEERRRRDFKAKPVRSAGAPSSIPRGTATSRARQLQGPVSENAPRTSPGTRKKVSFGVPHEPLSVASNQAQPRGRHLTTDSSQISRATSSSTGSLSGKRTSVSFEDVQAQRLRGREVLQRDSMYAQDRQRDKRDRETITRLAREQAAERSRLQSRQWAEEQKRKLKTVGPLGNTVALST